MAIKTLFISLNKDFFLSTAGNFVVIAYDLLNDIGYEIGAELTFLVKDDTLTDKACLFTDFRDSRPEDYDKMASLLNSIFAKVLLAQSIQDEISIILPEAYIDWLSYHSNRVYSEIGRKLRELDGQITLSPTDIFDDYIVNSLLSKIRETVLADDAIQKFTIQDLEIPESKIVDFITPLRTNLMFEVWSGSWVTCELGYAFNAGVGVVKDLITSFSYYEKSAHKDNLVATNWLGWCYQTALGTSQDYNKAFYWYKKGKELGNKASFANLGYCYDQGIGTEKDYSLAVENYKVGADAGIIWAQCNLANIYFNGWLGVPNYTEAFKYYKMCSTAQGQTHAIYQVGYMLYHGLGTEKNELASYDYFVRAANAGYSSAYYYCGKLIEDGIVLSSEDQKTRDDKAFQLYYKGQKANDINASIGCAEIWVKRDNWVLASSFFHRTISANHTSGMHMYVDCLLGLPTNAFKRNSELIEKIIKKLFELKYEEAKTIQIAYENRVKEEEEKKLAKVEAERIRKEEERKRMHTLIEVCEEDECYDERDEFGVSYNSRYPRIVRAYPFRNNLRSGIHKPDVTTYTIADGTEIICDGAFESCSNLTCISLPQSIKKVGGSAFQSCKKLTTINLPDSIDEIGSHAFWGCRSLIEIRLPKSLSIINAPGERSFIFDECDKLERIFIPKGMSDHFINILPEYAHLFVEI